MEAEGLLKQHLVLHGPLLREGREVCQVSQGLLHIMLVPKQHSQGLRSRSRTFIITMKGQSHSCIGLPTLATVWYLAFKWTHYPVSSCKTDGWTSYCFFHQCWSMQEVIYIVNRNGTIYMPNTLNCCIQAIQPTLSSSVQSNSDDAGSNTYSGKRTNKSGFSSPVLYYFGSV